MSHSTQKLSVTSDLLSEVTKSFRYDKYERGGLLFISNCHIIGYYLDNASKQRLSYHPSDTLLPILHDAIDKQYEFAFIHSHPGKGENPMLSDGDVFFAAEFLRLNPRFKSIYMALLTGESLKMYIFSDDGYITQCTVDAITGCSEDD